LKKLKESYLTFCEWQKIARKACINNLDKLSLFKLSNGGLVLGFS